MSIGFPKAEEDVLALWREIDAFQTQLQLTKGCERFTFYDGPPFGLPHYGHLLTLTIKDIIPRYWSMKQYHVVRRFGWDTHGVPIEYEIDKKLGMSGRDAVQKIGIEKYNAECRAIVMRYAGEWRHIIERLGRWIDFDNDYKTMDASFMESCWWVFKELWNKNKVYRAYQVMPFSTALCTPLELRRVDEVFDCWFESGSMPYASDHYPFENIDHFQGGLFPADFIAEGLDQTRGWFYTLSILGHHLFGRSPFKNVIVNGLVLAEDGKKMSKSLKDYPDPIGIIHTHGSDALRLYLINSPVVRAEPLRFKESGVKEVVTKVLLPLWNSYRFFHEQAVLFKSNTGNDFVSSALPAANSMNNVMDRWILADCQSMLRFIDQEMKGYRLCTVVPRLLRVIDNLTNWYIRFNRKRLKGTAGLGLQDTREALNVLCEILFTLVRALAPFTPFIAEHIYGLLRPYMGEQLSGFRDSRSVYFLPYPTVQESLFDEATERKVSAMQKVIQLGRAARERADLPLKTPVLSLVVIADVQNLSDVDELQSYVKEELNTREIVLSSDEERFNIILEARVDWPTLGKKLKKDVQVVRKALPGLTQDQPKRYLQETRLVIDGIELQEHDLHIVRILGARAPDGSAQEDGPKWEASFSEDVIVLVDVAPHPESLSDGLVRDIINRVQSMRKTAGLKPTDEVRIQYAVVSNPGGIDLDGLVASRQLVFESSLRGTLEPLLPTDKPNMGFILQEDHSIGNLALKLGLTRVGQDEQ